MPRDWCQILVHIFFLFRLIAKKLDINIFLLVHLAYVAIRAAVDHTVWQICFFFYRQKHSLP